MTSRGRDLPDRQVEGKRDVVLHVVSYDVSRGAERYARALIDVLNSRASLDHRLMTMFHGPEHGLGADIALDVPRGPLRRAGFDPRVLWRMKDAIADWRPTAVVAHGGEPAKYAAVVAGDIPYVYVMIGSSHPLLSNPLRKAVRNVYVRRASVIVAVSQHLAREAKVERGFSDVPLRVIANGRDPDLYRPSEKNDELVPEVLFVGRLEEQKRPHLFVSVMRQISERGVDATASIIGGGPLLESVAAQARPLEIDVLGSRSDVPDLLSRASLLILTSRPPEGMPGVLIEAGLSGLPVVTTDVPGAREIVVDGVTGFVVGVDDEKGLADAAEALIADPELRVKMGEAARERCATEFSIAASADAWEDLLERFAS